MVRMQYISISNIFKSLLFQNVHSLICFVEIPISWRKLDKLVLTTSDTLRHGFKATTTSISNIFSYILYLTQSYCFQPYIHPHYIPSFHHNQVLSGILLEFVLTHQIFVPSGIFYIQLQRNTKEPQNQTNTRIKLSNCIRKRRT